MPKAVGKQDAFGTVRFIRELLALHPYRIAFIVASMTIVSLAQGIGIALLVPLLSLIGIGQSALPSGRLMAWFASAFEFWGLPMVLETVLPIFLLFVTAENQLRYFQRRYTRTFLGNFVTNLRISLYEAYLNAAWPFWHTKHLGRMANLLGMESYRVMVAFYELTSFLSEIILVTVLLAVAFLLSWPLALLFLLGAGLLVSISASRLKNVAHTGTDVTTQNGLLQEAIQEHLQAAKLIKSSGMERQSLEIFQTIARKLNLTETKGNIQPYRVAAFLNPIVAAILCLVLYISLNHFKMDPAQVLVSLFIFYRISSRLVMIQQAWHGVLLNAPAYGAILLETREARLFSEQKETLNTVACPILGRSIDLDNVGYSYRPDVAVIRDISFSIPVGKTTALVGGSGSGKTTLLDLMLALIRPEYGRIKIDGVDLGEIDPIAWRNQIAYVGQETVLFHDSIVNNIRWANRQASDKEIETAARLAFAHEFISAMPEGYRTVIGSRGIRLSGGERQRIALARALVRHPRLLVLDEATSNLDAASEKAVQEAIDDLRTRMTIIIVAHRLATVQNADWIYVIEKGRVVQEGTWSELTQMEGQFSNLWSLQSGAAPR
jgi:ATP-binding cassette, subfamily C, bacterial